MEPSRLVKLARILALLSIVILPLNGVLVTYHGDRQDLELRMNLLSGLMVVQIASGLAASCIGILLWMRREPTKQIPTWRSGYGWSLLGFASAALAFPSWLIGILWMGVSSGGGASGRPLRVRGRQIHARLQVVSDWTRGHCRMRRD